MMDADPSGQEGSASKDQVCLGCGARGTHMHTRETCPAQGKKCHHCGRINHFVRVCKRKQMQENDSSPREVESLTMTFRDLTSTIQSMAFPVVEFSRQGYKIRKVFG
jgi:hypothetical protein